MLIRNEYDGTDSQVNRFQGTNYRDFRVNYLIVGDVACQSSDLFDRKQVHLRTVCGSAQDPKVARRRMSEIEASGVARNLEIVPCTNRRAEQSPQKTLKQKQLEEKIERTRKKLAELEQQRAGSAA